MKSNRLDQSVTHQLDRLVRPKIHLFGLSRSAFQICGYTGLALAILLAMNLVLRRGLSSAVMSGVVLCAVTSFLALAMTTKIITGRENLVYYYHEIAAIGFVTGFLWLGRKPVLPYLDATILGIGVFLAFGRIGCLMVGCCHGRPSRWGVCYRVEHAEAGFTPYYVGVRLFPIQAVESLYVFAIVAVGASLVWSGKPAGTALAWYIVAYDLGRFTFEFWRGDPARPYYRGFSEAQWISLLLVLFVASAEIAGFLPFEGWHLAAAVILLAAFAVTSLLLRRDPRRSHLLSAKHLVEMAEILNRIRLWNLRSGGAGHGEVPVITTSQGMRVSAGLLKDGTQESYLYTLSLANGVLTFKLARALAEVFHYIEAPTAQLTVVPGNQSIFHVVFSQPSPQREGG